jgi:hypothetical protein
VGPHEIAPASDVGVGAVVQAASTTRTIDRIASAIATRMPRANYAIRAAPTRALDGDPDGDVAIVQLALGAAMADDGHVESVTGTPEATVVCD